METSPTQRRPFQFSLRKMLLWTAVWSVYLGFAQLLGLPFALGLTIYLAILLAIRIKWGYRQGFFVAARVACLILICFGAPAIIMSFATLAWIPTGAFRPNETMATGSRR
jgi:hypothetical protein